MGLVRGDIQTTDAYLWSAAVSTLGPATETWWGILLVLRLPGSFRLSVAQTQTNHRLQLLFVRWKCIQERDLMFRRIYLQVRSVHDEGRDAARAPEIRVNTGNPSSATQPPRPAAPNSGLTTSGRAALPLRLREGRRSCPWETGRRVWDSGGDEGEAGEGGVKRGRKDGILIFRNIPLRL